VKKHATMSEAELQALANLVQQATRTENGLFALAEAVGPVIRMKIERKNIVPLILTEHTLSPGQDAKHTKRRALQAHYIGVGGQPHRQEVNNDQEVIFPVFRLHAKPMVDVTDLKSGNLGKIEEMQADAAQAIRNKLNAKLVALLSAAAATLPTSNVVTITGGKLTDTGLGQLISKINDLELNARYILLRGSRLIDLKDFNLDTESRREFVEKGVLNRFGGAGLVNTASMIASEVIVIPDMEVGKYDVRTALTVDPQKTDFKVGFLTYHECAMGITRPDLIFKAVITA
jgi:hypothetical protein